MLLLELAEPLLMQVGHPTTCKLVKPVRLSRPGYVTTAVKINCISCMLPLVFLVPFNIWRE
jgi:hypothetical protein